MRKIKRKKGINPSPDCQKCGRCCSNVRVGLWANGPLQEFLVAYWGKPVSKVDVHLKQRCKMLLPDNTCSIYERRPQMCREFKCRRDLTEKIEKFEQESPSFIEIG